MAIPAETAPRDNGPDLVIAQSTVFAANLVAVLAFGPGEVIGPLESGVPVDERTIVTFANRPESRNLKDRNAPEKRILRNALQAEFANHVPLKGALLDVT